MDQIYRVGSFRSPVALFDDTPTSDSEPRWSPDGVLHCLSDYGGWWNIYSEFGESVAPMDADCARPDWVFGQSWFALLPDDAFTEAGFRISVISELPWSPARCRSALERDHFNVQMSFARVADELGIHANQLRGWRNE